MLKKEHYCSVCSSSYVENRDALLKNMFDDSPM